MTDLLPCPFCGGEATLEEVPEKSMGGIRWTVGCNETDEDEEGGAFAVLCYGYQSLTTFATQHEAIAAWNRRASDARHAEDQAALAQANLKLAQLQGSRHEWTDETRAACKTFEQKYDVEVVSFEHHCTIAYRLHDSEVALAAMHQIVDAARMVAAATRHELALECRRMGMEESEYRTLLSASQTLLDDAINHLAAEAGGKNDAPQT